MFERQITDLILVFGTEYKAISVKHYRMNVYGYLLTFFDNLKHLSIIGSYSHYLENDMFKKKRLSLSSLQNIYSKKCIE
jgi:hypothetical protein